MPTDRRPFRLAAMIALAGIVLALGATPSHAQNADQALLRRLQVLEQRVQELEAERAANARTQSAQPPARTNGATANISPEALQALVDRLGTLEQRLGDIETSAVLSEPETRVKRKEIW